MGFLLLLSGTALIMVVAFLALISALLGLEYCILSGGVIRLGIPAALQFVGMVWARVSYVALDK